MVIKTLNRFDTVSSGAGENARLMYVNWDPNEHAKPKSGVNATHQWVSCLPTQFLSQELNHSLKPVRRGDLVEVLLHNWRISNSFEAYDNCSDGNVS